MQTLIVSVKRDKRAEAPADLAGVLRAIAGVQVTPTVRPDQVRVTAPASAVEAIRRAVGDTCHVEPVVPHERL